jgi:erythromycin esterase
MTKSLTHLLLVSLPILCNAQVTQIDLQENITEIKSINISDDDFTGYEVLAKKIGDANIVLLGEQTHGHGTTFIAKTKIIKYLVENHGFDVIAFESGFFEINKIWGQ